MAAGQGANAPFMVSLPLSEAPIELVGLISSIRDLEMSLEDAPASQEDTLARLAELAPPDLLFSNQVMPFRAVYAGLRDWLRARNVELPQHPTRRIIMSLAAGLYSEAAERETAMALAGSFLQASRAGQSATSAPATQGGGPAQSTLTSAEQPGSETASTQRLSHNVGMRFKEKAEKFSGAIGEAWMDFVSDYQQIAQDYEMSPTQKLKLLHNVLTGEAKRFYLDRVAGTARDFREAVSMIDQEFNSPVRQNKIKNHLSSLRLTSSISIGIRPSEALQNVYNTISKLGNQVPPSHRGDPHKVQFLRDSVVGFPWATEPLSRIASHQLSFQALFGELEAALQLHEEEQIAQQQARGKETAGPGRGADLTATYFQSQGRYLNAVKPRTRLTSKPGNRGRQAGQKINPLSITGCFNCDSPNHRMSDCPHPPDLKKAALRRMQYYEKKDSSRPSAIHVLFDLCEQLQEEELDPEEPARSPEPMESAQYFQALLEIGSREDAPGQGDQAPTTALADTSVEDSHSLFYGDSVHALESTHQTPTDDFLGACLDTGASKSVIGQRQSAAYCRAVGQEPHRESDTGGSFLFGDKRQDGLGRLKIRFPLGETHFFEFFVTVVPIDIPLLLGLDVLDKFKLVVDTVNNNLYSDASGLRLPLVRKRGHIFLEWTASIFYTLAELQKIHRHFFHPSPERLHALFKNANDPSGSSAVTLDQLKHISAECEVCQRHGPKPQRFRVTLPPDDITFNRTVLLDLMSLDGRPVLHVVDKETLFSAASFLQSESTEAVWTTFLSIWVTPYQGFPENMHTDQGPQFTSFAWENLLQQANINRVLSGVESHNSLGAGERYHSFLRHIYFRGMATSPNTEPEQVLSLAVMAMNCTAGPSGLCPSLLVFGAVPRYPTSISVDVPTQRARMRVLQKARTEMARLMARNRLKTAVRSKTTNQNREEIEIGSEVLFYREPPADTWSGPFLVTNRDQKLVTITNLDNGEEKRVSLDKLKPFKRSEKASNADVFKDIVASIPMPTLASTPQIFLTEPIDAKDPRADSPRFEEAKQKEIEGLLTRGTFSVVKKSALPKDSNVIGGRFVLTLKSAGTPDETPKARFVAQGFADSDKAFVVHNSSSFRQSSTKLLVSAAANHGWRVFSHDVTQAYVQADEAMTRKIYLRPKVSDLAYFPLQHGEILKVEKPLYGICDAGDYWSSTFDRHVRRDLGMSPLASDPSLYCKRDNETNVLHGLLGTYVDDGLLAGDQTFQELTEQTLKKFESKAREYDNVTFLGVMIQSHHSPEAAPYFTISQPGYLGKLDPMPANTTFERFRSIRACVAWLGHSRPDLSCAINRAAQVTATSFGPAAIKELNTAIRQTRDSAEVVLRYGPLQLDSLHLRVYSDAAFGNNHDQSSQLGHIILLCDANDACHMLAWASKKSRRVVRSIMAGEMYAFADAFDAAFIVRHDLEEIYAQKIPIWMLTDSRQVFDVVTKASHPTEKRLLIDIAAAREAYNRLDIKHVGLIDSQSNLADALTKPGHFPALLDVMRTGNASLRVNQWIQRNSSANDAPSRYGKRPSVEV